MDKSASSHLPIDTSVAVVIVGAGPTGLTAANLLGLAGITTLVLERHAGLSTYPKAITIDDEGLRICQMMGLIDKILPDLLLDIGASYRSGDHYFASVSPTGRRNGYPLISTFHQPTFEHTLLQGLERFSCVEMLFQHTVESFEQDEHGVSLAVHTPQGTLRHVACTYLLACDGGKSNIRHALNIPLQAPLAHVFPRRKAIRAASTQRWLVVDCVEDADAQREKVVFFCNPSRPAVTVPAPYGGRRWEFMLLPGEREEDLLNAKTIATLIQQTGSQATPHIARHAIYTFHASIAARFSQGRIFLLGDAAHMMPPFGGQGMNSGLRDAQNLCWKLALVMQGKANANLLETYHQERHPHAEQMVLFSSILGGLIMPTNRLTAFLRDGFFRGIVQRLPPMREAVEEMRVKPQPRYTRGFLLPPDSPENKAYRGLLLPQPAITTPEGKQILLDEMWGNAFVLIRLYEASATHSLSRNLGDWQLSGIRCVDVEMSWMKGFLKKKEPLYLLVRPDKYIMGAFKAKDFEQLAPRIAASIHISI